MSNFIAEATVDYENAYRLGKRSGGHLKYLDEVLKENHIRVPKEISLGLVEIPMEQIVGTKTEGRATAFAQNFYPILEPKTEFSNKWISLCASHLDEGIQEPIHAYEFMNEFYVVEGNKRVSVLKYFDAPSISAYVIRIVPPYKDDKETRIYYEFMKFYSLSSIYYIHFTKEGSYDKLQKLVGKHPVESWSIDEQRQFSSLYYHFLDTYQKMDIDKLSISPGDAFLSFINLYDYQTLIKEDYSEITKKLEQMEDEFKLLDSEDSIQLHMDPADSKKKNLLKRLLPTGVSHLKVGFIHKKSSETSGWTYAHELGRTHLENKFPNQVTTTFYNGATKENAAQLLEQAIADGNQLIFTTSPYLSKESLKAALEHPDVKILNCSLNNSHKSMRTYCLRIYEVKFILGAIAASISPNGKLGYVTGYPLYGTEIINAFALGAKMVNPRAKVYLPGDKILAEDKDYFAKNNISIICGKDMTAAGLFDPRFGLYEQRQDTLFHIAMPIWNWGRFYEKMIRNIMEGNWNLDDTSTETTGLSYWWGLSAGVVDIVLSRHLPSGTLKLANLLKENIAHYGFSPFSGILYSQDGLVQPDPNYTLTPKEILSMNWLSDNVVGTICKTEDEIIV
ncbi:MAG: BMP family ABC transporter substrate-binding protein [Lachnospiraceae bacterium]|jgi:basic membrane lipoprotein Med (substrate-binding protein (PBP1-ABC) superfamily)